ncbi:hypothetical protein RhiirA5_355512 [Rhizophagus irregularis]|uniref:Crystal protein ET79 n=2 Tax=Rhizophagus irregularis TaxID=588596 RepID=A0A2I1E2P5_9GLOM|nr:hypothetical protein GLOIN_2v1637317 [Rhizophagus irregularis DAOM 181602=DAOM 197198]PKC10425.1 hypothetical protein RhiirA5_355512 [Rhizophagus irregularis]PKC70015.1 hypothetical protein RhiirA1_414866 [Rhizophagus irregularis]PKK69507.1 hypothetical protein RhiirC2_866715 [Rhizophagus irregularis]PKY16412.1 hypothetical protein RhiirB3_402859 [Rhizophagus irregularis]POG68406.1 hypothetical protein GLOIN_2v1637317 [Rhizophagus irregularis DAOM 181602=DAOM 197198]|eukprot:XP_025175272.1 hypothetical protein GLOIN_2v1637317 [Rhizophagus irregularis DAOM 181602=DAOM 197198]
MKLIFFLLLLTFFAAVTNSELFAADRSASVTVINKSKIKLWLSSYELKKGAWETYPPVSIHPWSKGQWKSKSDSILTGTEGGTTYESVHGNFGFYWYVPYYGANLYNSSCPEKYECSCSGGDGSNAEVTFTVRKI